MRPLGLRSAIRFSLHVVPEPAGGWRIVGDTGAELDTNYVVREQAEAEAACRLERAGGGKVFVFAGDGQLLKVTRVLAELDA